MKRKRVLFLASWYPSKNNETLGNFVQRHAEAINEKVELTVLYVTSSASVSEVEIECEKINNVDTVIAYYPKINSNIPLYTALEKYKMYLKVSEKVFFTLNKSFDIVHLNVAYPAGLFALWLKKYHKLPYVITSHSSIYLDSKNEFQKLNWLTKWQHNKIFKEASAVSVVSKQLGESLIKLNLTSEYTVIPNVVDPTVFFKGEQVENEVTRFIHISTFDDESKNVTGIIKAFRLLQDNDFQFLIHIITEGDVQVVHNYMEKFGLVKANYKVESKLKPNDVANAIRKADCMVLFSNYETFSIVLAESWACGTPAIYAKCGGLTEIKNPKIGIQINKKDENELFNSLKKVIRKEIDFDTDEILDQSEAFSPHSVSKSFVDLYDNVLKNSFS